MKRGDTKQNDLWHSLFLLHILSYFSDFCFTDSYPFSLISVSSFMASSQRTYKLKLLTLEDILNIPQSTHTLFLGLVSPSTSAASPLKLLTTSYTPSPSIFFSLIPQTPVGCTHSSTRTALTRVTPQPQSLAL